MKRATAFLVLLITLFISKANAITDNSQALVMYYENDTLYITDASICKKEFSRPNPIQFLFKQKQKKNKRITAAVLAFPFPFGIVGLHRIYLGCAPHVPVVYIASIGGAFGVLPFIGFCVLVLDKDIDRFKNNKKVFMWAN